METFQDGTLKLDSSVLTIGAYDGLHIGHQDLIKSVKKRSEELNVPSVVYTFDPPPKIHFGKDEALMTLKEKINAIKQYNIDYLIVANFTSEYSSRDRSLFKKELSDLNPKDILVGADFKFGRNRSGTIEYLKRYFHVSPYPLILCKKGRVVSSSRIRKLKKENRINEMSHMF